MIHDEEYIIRLNSGKIVTIISALLCLLLIAFAGGVTIGKHDAKQVSSVTPDETSTTEAEKTPEPASVEEKSAAEKKQPTRVARNTPKPTTRTKVPSIDVPTVKASAEPVPAESPLPKVEKQVAPPRPAPVKQPEASPPPAKPKARYAIQVVASSNRTELERITGVLNKDSLDARVEPVPGSSSLYRALVGHFATKSDATGSLKTLKERFHFQGAFIRKI